MPFTFAHPAVVLPFGIKQTKYIDFTTLVIGTMAPDFEYFIYFKPMQIVGHTFMGQIYFNLPIIFIIAFIFHYILKEPLIVNLPKPYCDRYYYLVKNGWKINSLFKLIVVYYSALLGAFTHLVWDSFTHETGFFVVRIRFLSKYITIVDFKIPIYKILQHGSTMVGFLAIILYMLAIQNNKVNTKNCLQKSRLTKLKYWSGIFGISMAVFVLMIFHLNSLSLGRFVVTSINSMLIGILIMSVITHFHRI